MAIHGELVSFPLPELLQWLDGGRKTGILTLSWETGDRKLQLREGQIVGTSSPSLWERLARALEQGAFISGLQLIDALKVGHRNHAELKLPPQVTVALRELAREDLIASLADLTVAQSVDFHWTEDPDREDVDWVGLELPLRHALFESLRWVDEASDVDRVLAQDTLLVRPLDGVDQAQSTLHRIILQACGISGANIGRLRIVLGLQRGLIVRGIFELLRSRQVEVDGAVELKTDPVADMLEKGAVLLRERQFEAASLIFSALLQSDPSDRRVREFLRMVEREHVAEIYRDLPPVRVLEHVDDRDAEASLRADERQVAELVNGRWDVSTLVLASQHRELDTLKALNKLLRLGLVRPVGE